MSAIEQQITGHYRIQDAITATDFYGAKSEHNVKNGIPHMQPWSKSHKRSIPSLLAVTALSWSSYVLRIATVCFDSFDSLTITSYKPKKNVQSVDQSAAIALTSGWRSGGLTDF